MSSKKNTGIEIDSLEELKELIEKKAEDTMLVITMEVVLRWSSIFVTFTLKKIIDWNISFQTVSCIHLMNVDVYDCNSHIHNPTCFHLTLDLFQTDSVI